MTTEVTTVTNKNIQQQSDSGHLMKVLGILLFLVMFSVIVVSFSKTLENVVYNTSNLSQKVSVHSVKILGVESKQQSDVIQLLDNDEKIANQVKMQQAQLYEQQMQLSFQEEKIKLLEKSFNTLLKSQESLLEDNWALHMKLKKVIGE